MGWPHFRAKLLDRRLDDRPYVDSGPLLGLPCWRALFVRLHVKPDVATAGSPSHGEDGMAAQIVRDQTFGVFLVVVCWRPGMGLPQSQNSRGSSPSI